MNVRSALRAAMYGLQPGELPSISCTHECSCWHCKTSARKLQGQIRGNDYESDDVVGDKKTGATMCAPVLVLGVIDGI